MLPPVSAREGTLVFLMQKDGIQLMEANQTRDAQAPIEEETLELFAVIPHAKPPQYEFYNHSEQAPGLPTVSFTTTQTKHQASPV